MPLYNLVVLFMSNSSPEEAKSNYSWNSSFMDKVEEVGMLLIDKYDMEGNDEMRGGSIASGNTSDPDGRREFRRVLLEEYIYENGVEGDYCISSALEIIYNGYREAFRNYDGTYFLSNFYLLQSFTIRLFIIHSRDLVIELEGLQPEGKKFIQFTQTISYVGIGKVIGRYDDAYEVVSYSNRTKKSGAEKPLPKDSDVCKERLRFGKHDFVMVSLLELLIKGELDDSHLERLSELMLSESE